MVGTDAVHFERAFHAAGLRRQHRTLAMLFDETVREHVGNTAASGIWSVQSYFRELDTLASNRLKLRWAERFGPVAAPLSSTAATALELVADENLNEAAVLAAWAEAPRRGRGGP